MQNYFFLRYNNMTIINTNNTQVFKTIPTKDVIGNLSIVIQNETTKTSYTVAVSSYSYSQDILSINVTLNFLVNNTFFTYKLLMAGEVIYKDRIYCTNGTENLYTLPTIDNNNYITI
jgi:hypothetical protein